MPYILRKRGRETCVLNQQTGQTVPGGCHPTRAQALRHMRALYVNVPDARRASVDSLTAALPAAPPRSLFERPEPDRPQPMTYEDSGAVYGHLALWESCHRGFQNGAQTQCVRPPRSNTGYQQFHLGHMQTAEGDSIAVGKITFDTDHAPITADAVVASRHYDHTGSVGAYVRASNGRLGIWLSGVLSPGLAPEGLVALRGNPLSGDWRSLNRNLELVASLAVPVPGFPIALAASGEPLVLIASLDLEEDMAVSYSSAQRRRKRMLSQQMASLTAAVLTTKSRNALPRSSFAIPEDRAYPIHDLAHARNALARSAGKPEEARVRRAVCKRYPQLCK